MATFHLSGQIMMTFVNHSNTEINWDVRDISSTPSNYGNVAPGATSTSTSWQQFPSTIEEGDIPVVGIGQFGQPQLVSAPGVRFWTGESVLEKFQYINLLAGNGWQVTKNTSELSEVTGNGFRVTVDAGGHNPQETLFIYFQVYNA
jgi:hypothetical protein